jgi:hypothetical protein
MEPTAAKEFLISRVIQEAAVEQVDLSDVERKMLYFTEVHAPIPDIYETNAEFERNYNSYEYEAKVASLLKNARDRDRNESSSREQGWKDALDALKKEDHYILVMVAQAFGGASHTRKSSRLRDFLMYIAIGVGLVLILFLASMWRAGH